MYEYTISFRSSTSHSNADALSRLPLVTEDQDPPVPTETVLVLEQLSESPLSVEQIRTWTRRDPLLSKVLQYILSGWPRPLDSSETTYKPFVIRELELSSQDGIILWGNRVVIPPPGRNLILDELHACHPGIGRMKTLARMFVWWPGLDMEIGKFVQQCSICQSQRSTSPPVPIRPWQWPTTPWHRLHVDLAGPFLGHMYLILIDAHSKWLEVRILPSITSSSIISSLRSIFAQFGLPSVIVTDNGHYFTSGEFQQFLLSIGTKHLLSSPYHPSSNGLAERAVQVFKKDMMKLTTGSIGDRISHILFYNHITPHTTTGLSPAELLQNRHLRCRLDLVKPDIHSRVEGKQLRQQLHSRGSKDRHFNVGDAVYVKNFHKGPPWISGNILAAIGNVSYQISMEDGRSFTRHVDHLRERFDRVSSNVPVSETTFPSIVSLPVPFEESADSSDTPSNQLDTPSDRPDTPSDRSDTPSEPSVRYPTRQRNQPNRYVPSDFRKEKTVIN